MRVASKFPIAFWKSLMHRRGASASRITRKPYRMEPQRAAKWTIGERIQRAEKHLESIDRKLGDQ
jgi:hypothetical protein